MIRLNLFLGIFWRTRRGFGIFIYVRCNYTINWKIKRFKSELTVSHLASGDVCVPWHGRRRM